MHLTLDGPIPGEEGEWGLGGYIQNIFFVRK